MDVFGKTTVAIKPPHDVDGFTYLRSGWLSRPRIVGFRPVGIAATERQARCHEDASQSLYQKGRAGRVNALFSQGIDTPPLAFRTGLVPTGPNWLDPSRLRSMDFLSRSGVE